MWNIVAFAATLRPSGQPGYLRIEAIVSEFEELHLPAASAAALRELGWTAGDPLARAAAPTAARGHNLVVVTPPAAAWAAPALAGWLGRLGPEAPGVALVPAAELDTWAGLARALTRGLGLRIEVARGAARATRRLRAREVDLLLTPPEIALLLAGASALKTESLAGILVARVEDMDAADTLAPLFADLPADAQRLLFTTREDRAADFAERMARKAVIANAGASVPSGGSTEPLRTAATAWHRRPAALAEILELLDPGSLVVWTADRSAHEAIARALPVGEPAVRVVTGDAPAAEVVVAFDPPTPSRLAQLRSAGSVVLLLPPGTEAWAARLGLPLRPLRLPGPLDEARNAAAARRRQVEQQISTADHAGAWAELGPLLERHDATAVAAALYELWSATPPRAEPAAPAAAPTSAPAASTSRVYVGIGKRDQATPADIVATLVKDLRVDKAQIGRIEVRESYTLVEVPAPDAERIAAALDGRTIRRRRVSARLDRGAARSRR